MTIQSRRPLIGLAVAAGMVGALTAVSMPMSAPVPQAPRVERPANAVRRKKKGPAPRDMNRRHLRPQSAFMRQIAEERAIGIHPKYRNAAHRRRDPITAESWEAKQKSWRAANLVAA